MLAVVDASSHLITDPGVINASLLASRGVSPVRRVNSHDKPPYVSDIYMYSKYKYILAHTWCILRSRVLFLWTLISPRNAKSEVVYVNFVTTVYVITPQAWRTSPSP